MINRGGFHERMRTAGFTLVELLVVIAFIALAIGVAIPLVNDQVRAADVRQAADNMGVSLRAARMISVAKHKDIVFTVNVDPTNSYSYEKTDGTILTVTMPVRVKITTGSTASLTFKANGAVSAASTIIVQSPVGGAIEQWTITVNTLGLADLTHQRI